MSNVLWTIDTVVFPATGGGDNVREVGDEEVVSSVWRRRKAPQAARILWMSMFSAEGEGDSCSL